MPSHNRDAWEAKFARNKQRDAEVDARLGALGLRVFTVWECETKDSVALKDTLRTYFG